MQITSQVVIVGGGLSGLTLAYLLDRKNIKVTLIEASSRLGGRIQTQQGVLHTPLELGATWFSEMHPNLLFLMEELGVQKFPQFSKGKSLFQTKSFEPAQEFFVPESNEPSYRMVKGTQSLIDTLFQKTKFEKMHFNTRIKVIKDLDNRIELESTAGDKFYAKQVFLCLPPQLVAKKIEIYPELPQDLMDLMPNVQTWMAGSIKFVLEYSIPFWRENGYSGMLYSHSGIISEMYDHTNFEGDKFGFTGFLNGGATSYSQDLRKELVLKQLNQLLGSQASTPLAYFDKVWTDDFISAGSQSNQRPHQNNGHPLFHQGYLGNKLFFGGTETASQSSGYMEGAVISALSLVKCVEV